MPFLRPQIRGTGPWNEWDAKAQKNGLHRTIYFVNGSEYTGEWKDNLKHGKGVFKWKNGNVYNGEWRDDKRHGVGTLSVRIRGTMDSLRVEYSGYWEDDMRHGQGIRYYLNGSVYDGKWSVNQRTSWGKMYYANGEIYEGEWKDDVRSGRGMHRLVNENRYEGGWSRDQKDGHGIFYFLDSGQLYEGLWREGYAKCGKVSDYNRDEATSPTKFPIPCLCLLDPRRVLREAVEEYS